MKTLAGKPFVLLGINSDKDRDALKQTLVDEDITWRSWWDQTIDGAIYNLSVNGYLIWVVCFSKHHIRKPPRSLIFRSQLRE